MFGDGSKWPLKVALEATFIKYQCLPIAKVSGNKHHFAACCITQLHNSTAYVCYMNLKGNNMNTNFKSVSVCLQDFIKE